MAYNTKIVIQQRTDTRDTYGELDPAWATYKTVWAERDDEGGMVGYSSEQPVFSDSISFRIHIHDAPNVTTKMRIRYDDKSYLIRNVTKEDRLHLILIGEAYDDE